MLKLIHTSDTTNDACLYISATYMYLNIYFILKIENEEYGEALELARQYSLDCDMVYQCQWQLSVPSVASIEDYLSKVSKMSWVLKECLHSVAPDFLTMKELLSYGLHRTAFK